MRILGTACSGSIKPKRFADIIVHALEVLPPKNTVIENFTEEYLPLREFLHYIIKAFLHGKDPEGPPVKGLIYKPC